MRFVRSSSSFEGRLFGLALGVVLPLGGLMGCGDPAATDEPVRPPTLPFVGIVDARYSGKWSTANKGSTLELGSDGKAKMVNVAPGRGVTTTTGKWKISEESLLIRADGGDHVSRYAAKLKGDTLRLTQKSTRLDVVYRRAE